MIKVKKKSEAKFIKRGSRFTLASAVRVMRDFLDDINGDAHYENIPMKDGAKRALREMIGRIEAERILNSLSQKGNE